MPSKDALMQLSKEDLAMELANANQLVASLDSSALMLRLNQLEEKIKALSEENAALKAQAERMGAPVTDEEWLGLCAGDHVQETEVQRRDIDALLASRQSTQDAPKEQPPSSTWTDNQLGQVCRILRQAANNDQPVERPPRAC